MFVFLFKNMNNLIITFRGLNRITMNTLNEQRLNIVLEHFFSGNDIITPNKAKQFERYIPFNYLFIYYEKISINSLI